MALTLPDDDVADLAHAVAEFAPERGKDFDAEEAVTRSAAQRSPICHS